jgi:ribonuclease D
VILSPPSVFEGDIDAATWEKLRSEAALHGLAVDLETTGLSPVTDRIEVVALATPLSAAVVVLRRGAAPPAVRSLLESRAIEKVFHHAAFDVGFLRYRWDLAVEPVFCTKVAARIAEVALNPRLETLVKDLLGVDLDKGEQRSDWSARPLSAAQLGYAARDVAHLHSLREELERRLTRLGRWTLFQSCMRFLSARVELGFLGLDDVFAYALPEPAGAGKNAS